MQWLKCAQRDASRGPLVLVNATHPLADDRVPELARFASGGRAAPLEREAASRLAELVRAIGAEGQIVPVSGWRSREEQRRIYMDSLRENGAPFTRQYVAMPGCSEHQTGLAIDLARQAEQIDFIRPDFPDEGICAEFRRRVPEFGFVLRYAADRQAVTGIAHEPWHFRYVGAPHAQLMEQNAQCLEEYLAWLREFPWNARPLRLPTPGAAIGYARCGEAIAVPDGADVRISGDNAGGCVVTLWEREAKCDHERRHAPRVD